MHKLFQALILSLIFLLFAAFLPAQTLEEADALFAKNNRESIQEAIAIYTKLLETSPDDFELNWKCARACREYAQLVKKGRLEDWDDICADYGRRGMGYAAKAKEMQPEHPAGFYYYGLCVGIYSDGTSILTALSEGLKDKTQQAFEKVYELDKMYAEAGAILALGRFWAVLPWPMYDKDDSLAYYREFQQTEYFQTSDEGKVYLGELLISMGGKERKAEARKILERVVPSGDVYYADWAGRLLEKI